VQLPLTISQFSHDSVEWISSEGNVNKISGFSNINLWHFHGNAGDDTFTKAHVKSLLLFASSLLGSAGRKLGVKKIQ
jgi:hypothetical protein